MKAHRIALSAVALTMLCAQYAVPGAEKEEDDFMTNAVKRMVTEDTKRIAKQVFPQLDLLSAETTSIVKKTKELYPMVIVVKLSKDVVATFSLIGRVNYKKGHGLQYTIDIKEVTSCDFKMKKKPYLPPTIADSLEDLGDVLKEKASAAAAKAYPKEKVASAEVGKLTGLGNERKGEVVVKMSNDITVKLLAKGGATYHTEDEEFVPALFGFEKATYLKGGKPDTPAKPIPLLGEKKKPTK